MKDENDRVTLEMPGLLPEEEGGKRGRGRPRQHADQAARQKAYRERLKASGKRVLSVIVTDTRDESKPLTSDVIDLSEVRQPRRR